MVEDVVRIASLEKLGQSGNNMGEGGPGGCVGGAKKAGPDHEPPRLGGGDRARGVMPESKPERRPAGQSCPRLFPCPSHVLIKPLVSTAVPPGSFPLNWLIYRL